MNSFLIKQQIFCVLNKSRELFIFTIFLFKFNTNCEFFIDTARSHSYEIINTKKTDNFDAIFRRMETSEGKNFQNIFRIYGLF